VHKVLSCREANRIIATVQRGKDSGMRKALLVAGACGLCVSACGDDGKESLGWLGEAPHIVIKGSVSDEDLDIEIVDEDEVGVTQVVCEREYNIPVIDGESARDMAMFVGFEISAVIEVDGEARQFELDVEGPGILERVG
jgi:hypothetical protein